MVYLWRAIYHVHSAQHDSSWLNPVLLMSRSSQKSAQLLHTMLYMAEFLRIQDLGSVNDSSEAR